MKKQNKQLILREELHTITEKSLRTLVGIALGYAVLEATGVSCPIKWLTGCSCAGCGLSRAWISVLSLDFPSASSFHSLFWMPAVLTVTWLMNGYLPNLLRRVLLLAGIVSMLAIYCCRLLDHEDMIVVWRPWEGMLFRLIRTLGQYCRL